MGRDGANSGWETATGTEPVCARGRAPAWAEVNLRGVSIERLRHVGEVALGLSLWKRLGLEACCQTRIPPGREEVPWSVMAAVLVVARWCAPLSALRIAESWVQKTALDDLLGIAAEKLNDDRTYRALDALLPHKEALCQYLQQWYGALFWATCDCLFYDITSAYFEGSGASNPQAKRGDSRDDRSDCVHVCVGVIVIRDGVPLACDAFDGNRTDVTMEVRVDEHGSGPDVRVRIQVHKDHMRYAWALTTSGSDLLRTNWREGIPTDIWKTAMQLTQMEDAFRITKSDLGIRPIAHQRSDQVHAHILVCFLALAMWRILQQWMLGCGLGTAPRTLLEEMREIRSMDAILPTRENTLRLRVASTAPKASSILLYRLKLPLQPATNDSECSADCGCCRRLMT